MFSPWKLGLFFVLCLAASLAANTPAALVLPRLQLDPALRLAGVDGSVVRGRIERLEFHALALDGVRFRLRPRCLLALELCYRLEAADGELLYAYDPLSGDATISDARLELPAAALAELGAALPLRLIGRLELELAELRLAAGRPVALDGQLVWRGMGADDGGQALRLGDYRASVSGDGEQYRAEFATLDASLRIDGDGDLRADGRYRLDLAIGSEQPIDSRIKTLLELFARENGYNQYRVRREGQLAPARLGPLFPPA